MMMKLEQVPTFFCSGTCQMTNAKDKPVDCMPNVTRVSVEDKPVY